MWLSFTTCVCKSMHNAVPALHSGTVQSPKPQSKTSPTCSIAAPHSQSVYTQICLNLINRTKLSHTNSWCIKTQNSNKTQLGKKEMKYSHTTQRSHTVLMLSTVNCSYSRVGSHLNSKKLHFITKYTNSLLVCFNVIVTAVKLILHCSAD